MTLASLERRLAKIEAKSHGDSRPFFLIWATPESDLAMPITAAIKAGRCAKGDPAFCFPWPYDDPMPAARWTTVQKISDAEVTAIGDHALRNTSAELRKAASRSSTCARRVIPTSRS